MLLDDTKKILRDAGWYEGRKIDISEHIRFLEDNGYEVFDALKKWLEEFGDLNIVMENELFDPELFDDIDDDEYDYYSHIRHSTCIKEIIDGYKERVRARKENMNLDSDVKEKTVPVAEIDNNGVLVYISESGKFYTDRGLFDSNTDNFLNDTLAHANIEKPLTWIEIEKNKRFD